MAYIDEVARQGDEGLQPSDWRRYRDDDTWHIEENCDDESAKRFTDHLNSIWTGLFASLKRQGGRVPPPNLAILSKTTIKLGRIYYG